MVVKMSSPGRSFGGVADYCLHDPRFGAAQTGADHGNPSVTDGRIPVRTKGSLMVSD